MNQNQQASPQPPRRPIDEIVKERCEQFAKELMADVPEVDAIGFIFASRYMNPDVLNGMLVGPTGPVLDPISSFQLSRALTNVGEHIWGNLLPQFLQGLEELAEEGARLVNEQAQPLARMGQPADPQAPPRHEGSQAEGGRQALDGQHG